MASDQWPPAAVADLMTTMGEWDAWYTGSTHRLTDLYARQTALATRSPGVVGRLRRWFWGEPANSAASPQAKVHIPLAADICQASSDLLFGDPPTVKIEDPKAQARLDLIFGSGDAHQALAGAAETAAALGGVFVRVVWDTDVAPHPFLARVDADRAIPEFRWGRLVAVTFWRVVKEKHTAVWRHLERHELDALGVGIVRHSLHVGTATALGNLEPLGALPETAPLAAVADADGVVSTGSPGLDVAYVPNQTPNRAWRHHPIGAHLGRSDLDGIESLLDRFDEAWSSWMRELRIGKARIVAAQSALDDNGPGAGATLDLDREVYEAVNTPPGAADTGDGLPIRAVQFAIRVEEHRATCQELLEQILRSAGYSAQTFGADESGGAMTATEVQARERRSFTTRKRKLRPWVGALEALAAKALAIDAAVFGQPAPPADKPVSVTFAPAVQEAPEAIARTVQAMRQATAMSIETAVRMQHPEWSEPDVTAEVDRIRQEQGVPAPDPDVLGVHGTDLHPFYGPDDPDGGDPTDDEE